MNNLEDITQQLILLNESIEEYLDLNSKESSIDNIEDLNDLEKLANNLNVLKCVKEDLAIKQKSFEIESLLEQLSLFFSSIGNLNDNFNALANFYFNLKFQNQEFNVEEQQVQTNNDNSSNSNFSELDTQFIEKKTLDKIDSEVYGAEYLK